MAMVLRSEHFTVGASGVITIFWVVCLVLIRVCNIPMVNQATTICMNASVNHDRPAGVRYVYALKWGLHLVVSVIILGCINQLKALTGLALLLISSARGACRSATFLSLFAVTTLDAT